MNIGDRIKDNDPRMGNRVLMITGLLPFGVVAMDRMGKNRRYLSKHIHTDGKPRRGGFDLIPAAALAAPRAASAEKEPK